MMLGANSRYQGVLHHWIFCIRISQYLLNGYLACQNSNVMNRPTGRLQANACLRRSVLIGRFFNQDHLILPLEFTFSSYNGRDGKVIRHDIQFPAALTLQKWDR